MAIYEYEILDGDGAVVGIYETEQKMSDPALTEHPVTSQRLRRILSATFAHGSRANSPSSCADATCGAGGFDAGGCCGGAGGFDAGGCCGGGNCGLN
jgi:hypothetical protein